MEVSSAVAVATAMGRRYREGMHVVFGLTSHGERGSSVVECRIRNRESPGSNLLCYHFKFGHFRSLLSGNVSE